MNRGKRGPREAKNKAPQPQLIDRLAASTPAGFFTGLQETRGIAVFACEGGRTVVVMRRQQPHGWRCRVFSAAGYPPAANRFFVQVDRPQNRSDFKACTGPQAAAEIDRYLSEVSAAMAAESAKANQRAEVAP